jgi:Cysteine rich repeat
MKNVVSILILCVAALPLVGTEVWAGDARPCADDVAKFCKDVKPGGGRLAKCLKEHEKELSAACRAHQAEVRTKVKEAFQACHDEVSQFCKDVKPGGGRIVKCLSEHEAELSAECREKLGQGKKK